MLARSVGVLTVAISNFSSTGGKDAICGIDNETSVKRPRMIATNQTTRMNVPRMKSRARIPSPTTLRPINCSLTISLIVPLWAVRSAWPCVQRYIQNPKLTIQSFRSFGSSSAFDAPAIAGRPCGNPALLDTAGAFALSPMVATQKMKATIMQNKNVHKAMMVDA